MNHEEISSRIFLSPDSLTLTQEQVRWATEISQLAPTQNWRVYLMSLGLLGIEQWLAERAPTLQLESEWLNCRNAATTPSPAQITRLPDSIGRLQVGAFRLQLVITNDPGDEEVLVPQALIDRTEQRPHFYVLVEVLEEIAQVNIYGYLKPDQLDQYCRLTGLEQEEEETYVLPLNWFTASPGDLLLYLQHLAPAPSLTQQVINAKRWLQNQLDQVAEELAWVLLPPTPQSAMMTMRSTADQLDAMMSDLIARGEIVVPPQIGQAYYDVNVGGEVLRLYAIAWELRTTETPEWMLLLILGTPTGSRLPTETRLQVSDADQVLADVTVQNRQDSYLYTQVQGEQTEQFQVTIALGADESVTLPPIGFANAELQ